MNALYEPTALVVLVSLGSGQIVLLLALARRSNHLRRRLTEEATFGMTEERTLPGWMARRR